MRHHTTPKQTPPNSLSRVQFQRVRAARRPARMQQVVTGGATGVRTLLGEECHEVLHVYLKASPCTRRPSLPPPTHASRRSTIVSQPV